MELNIFLLTIISGFVGTIAMTIVMYLYGNLTKKKTKVVHILGLMMTGNLALSKEQKTKILTTGSIAHLFIGILFSFAYFLLWNWGVFNISTFDSIIVGALSGVLAIIVWKSYFNVYRKPPRVPLPHYFTALFISHIVFGLVTVSVFNLISD
ncbi:hypothetical protein [Marivirga sp.]|uniref:hypothetical protein n=1 Tax=Marivirga sp. TaxID=2018662 RepID=UPI0025CE5FA1|nr:hypothetical protein [Marivirga sp.]